MVNKTKKGGHGLAIHSEEPDPLLWSPDPLCSPSIPNPRHTIERGRRRWRAAATIDGDGGGWPATQWCKSWWIQSLPELRDREWERERAKPKPQTREPCHRWTTEREREQVTTTWQQGHEPRPETLSEGRKRKRERVGGWGRDWCFTAAAGGDWTDWWVAPVTWLNRTQWMATTEEAEERSIAGQQQ